MKAITFLIIASSSFSVSRRHAFIHPTLEQRYLLLRPGVIAWHAAIFQTRMYCRSLIFDVRIRREIKAHTLHGHYIGRITEQGSNIACETKCHLRSSTILECTERREKITQMPP